jgi:hypothetical protein
MHELLLYKNKFIFLSSNNLEFKRMRDVFKGCQLFSISNVRNGDGVEPYSAREIDGVKDIDDGIEGCLKYAGFDKEFMEMYVEEKSGIDGFFGEAYELDGEDAYFGTFRQIYKDYVKIKNLCQGEEEVRREIEGVKERWFKA